MIHATITFEQAFLMLSKHLEGINVPAMGAMAKAIITATDRLSRPDDDILLQACEVQEITYAGGDSVAKFTVRAAYRGSRELTFQLYMNGTSDLMDGKDSRPLSYKDVLQCLLLIANHRIALNSISSWTEGYRELCVPNFVTIVEAAEDALVRAGHAIVPGQLP